MPHRCTTVVPDHNSSSPVNSLSICNNEWILKLSYLADIFSKINELNLKLQGKENCEEVQSYKKSIMLWQARLTVEQPLYYMFPTCLQHIEENGTSEESLKKTKCDMGTS